MIEFRHTSPLDDEDLDFMNDLIISLLTGWSTSGNHFEGQLDEDALTNLNKVRQNACINAYKMAYEAVIAKREFFDAALKYHINILKEKSDET